MKVTGTASKKKLALVDGASLEKSLKAHDIEKIDADILRRLLLKKIPGAYEFARDPIITMKPDLAYGDLGNAFTRKGFEVCGVRSDGEGDDFVLRDFIREANPAEVGQIVMVSSDSGYTRALFEKWRLGVGIFWFMADSQDDRDGKSRIGERLRKFFACGAFTWVRMEPFIPSLQYPSPALEHKHHRQSGHSHGR